MNMPQINVSYLNTQIIFSTIYLSILTFMMLYLYAQLIYSFSTSLPLSDKIVQSRKDKSEDGVVK